MKKIIFLFVIVTLYTYGNISAQNLNEVLDGLFEKHYVKTQIGASMLISKKGRSIYENQIGMANVENNVAVTSKTKFPIGSITKQFTAAAILLLEEQGKLSLNDPITKYLSSFTPKEHPVSIRQLLTHTSGVKDYPQVAEIRSKIRSNLTPSEIIEMLDGKPLEFMPGDAMSYSNSGYILLGLLIEEISAATYAEFMKANVFDVLGMRNTEVNSSEAIVQDRATGYSEDENDQLIHATYHSSAFSAGAIISTPEDMNKWISGLRTGALLSKASLAKMFTNYTLNNGEETNQGLGWEINEIAASKEFDHSGFIPGYKANSVYFPEEELYVIVLQNNEYNSPTPVMIRAAATCLGRPYPAQSDAIKLSTTEISNLTGVYELENNDKRILFEKDGNLFIKAIGGQVSPLFAKSGSVLFYEEGYRQLHFLNMGSEGFSAYEYKNRMFKKKATKISNKVPLEKDVVEISVDTLAQYTGVYEFEPFRMAVTLENTSLFVQPDGSNKLALLPTSSDGFIVEEIGAEVAFVRSNGASMIMSMLVEGEIMEGKREGK